ncbi:MAG: hypothetical protein Kow006_22430 [Gammaproteobacteria bacterium]
MTLLWSAGAGADQGYWVGVAGEIESTLGQALARYRDHDSNAAKRLITKAYFGLFEGRKMEAAMRMEQGARHTFKVERRFGELRKAIKRGEAPGQLSERIDELVDRLREDAAALDRAGITPEVFRTGQ